MEDKYLIALDLIGELIKQLEFSIEKTLVYLNSKNIIKEDIAYIVCKAFGINRWVRYINFKLENVKCFDNIEKEKYLQYIDGTLKHYFNCDDYGKISFEQEKLKVRLIELRSWLINKK